MLELREAIESAMVDEPADAPIESTPVESTPIESPIESTPTEPPVETPTIEQTEKVATSTEKPTDKPVEDSAKEVARHRVDRPPQSWKKGEKELWGTLPVNIRQEIHRREDQINQTLNESAQYRQTVEQFQQIASPYMARLRSLDASPMQAFDHLLKADYALSTSPKIQRAQLMADLINNYDIDIDTLGQVLAGAAPQETSQQMPDIQALVQQQLQQALAPIYQKEAQQQQYEQQKVMQSTEAMRYDSVNYPYFEQVREDMADIIEMGARRIPPVDISLDEAYKKAVILNPTTATQLQQQSAQQQAVQKNQQAQRALTASSSVTGTPSAGGMSTFTSDGSLRGAIEAAFGGDRL